MDEKKPYIVDGQRVTLEEYRKTKYEDLRIRIPKGQKSAIQAAADAVGESINMYTQKALLARMGLDEWDEKSTPDE